MGATCGGQKSSSKRGQHVGEHEKKLVKENVAPRAWSNLRLLLGLGNSLLMKSQNTILGICSPKNYTETSVQYI